MVSRALLFRMSMPILTLYMLPSNTRCRSKGFDYACPIGPALVSPALFERNASSPLLQVTGRLNGKIRQSAPTSNLVFSVAKIISFLSQGTTLERGSIILTGTPAGVGTFDKPMTFLKDGDVFEVSLVSTVQCSHRETRWMASHAHPLSLWPLCTSHRSNAQEESVLCATQSCTSRETGRSISNAIARHGFCGLKAVLLWTIRSLRRGKNERSARTQSQILYEGFLIDSK